MQQLWYRLGAQDQRLIASLAARAAPRWIDRSLRLITHAGGAAVTVGVSLLLIALPATRHLGLVAGMANLLSHLGVQALKRTVVRRRPTVALPHLSALADLPDHFSFPSGHSAAASAIATAVCLTAPLAGVPAAALALLVGASRVYLRVHYVTDVVVGQVLGAATAILVAQSLS